MGGGSLTYFKSLAGLAAAATTTAAMAPAGAAADFFKMPLCGRSFRLEEANIDDMQKAMGNGTVTAVQLVECYAQRVLQTDDYINLTACLFRMMEKLTAAVPSSLLEFNPDALDIAANLDRERRAGKVRGPMHGIPFTVKENIGTKDKMETTAGSWALLGSRVPRDAFVVKKLREAGGVLLGKATLSEWADMRSNNYSEGYSARGGQARSPYNFTVNPGGSSSGSAIGVAANAVAVSLGTETDGSVINPAMRNSVVGFKPTVGLTSRAGVVPETEHQDTVGTFGRSVRDAVYTLDAIYGKDQRDNYTLAQQSPRGGYTQFLTNKRALRGAAFGLPWQCFWRHADPEQLRQLTALLDLIKEAGATIINGTEITDYGTIVSPDWWDWDWGTRRGYPNESEYTVVAVDFYNNINTYLSELDNTDIRSLEDIVQYNYDNDGTEGGNPWPLGNPAFYSGQDGFLASLATKGIQDETYWQALEFTQTKTRKGIDDALNYKGKKLNGLLVPPAVGQSYQISAQAGYPIITLPAGIHSASGMPFGLAILQTAWAESELVKFGSAIEDLQKTTAGNQYKRSFPTWEGYKKKPIPLLNIYEGSD
ncbi:LOW QUALITY PROTEIN: hypothetical protein QC761_611400 [Podospora bellae-mahoneyi]|uniref:Amidase domain-containing protein n=1 Tax=Podospora bellae-mahoneyi TaxID=2093777 RepID=A0ABR0FAD2_9PEZI|nr:LOW QUALITY PROTEIN: hypothetical protein QC761_611400 [Podospora bellae-mahoneyi]